MLSVEKRLACSNWQDMYLYIFMKYLFVSLGFNFDNDALDVLVLKTAFFHIMYYAALGIFTVCKLAFYVSLFPVFYAFH